MCVRCARALVNRATHQFRINRTVCGAWKCVRDARPRAARCAIYAIRTWRMRARQDVCCPPSFALGLPRPRTARAYYSIIIRTQRRRRRRRRRHCASVTVKLVSPMCVPCVRACVREFIIISAPGDGRERGHLCATATGTKAREQPNTKHDPLRDWQWSTDIL